MRALFTEHTICEIQKGQHVRTSVVTSGTCQTVNNRHSIRDSGFATLITTFTEEDQTNSEVFNVFYLLINI